MPHDQSILDDERLRRLVAYSETLGDGIGQPAVFDHKDNRGFDSWNAVRKIREVPVDVSADRTLRAMLENDNGIGFGSF